MAIKKVREYFKGLQMEERVLEFEVSGATVELARTACAFSGWVDVCMGWA